MESFDNTNVSKEESQIGFSVFMGKKKKNFIKTFDKQMMKNPHCHTEGHSPCESQSDLHSLDNRQTVQIIIIWWGR